MSELIQIRDQIEQSKQYLSLLAEQHGMQDYKVLQQSRALDELINRYIRLAKNNLKRK
ncbi:aspartyl-phosphate phosphatase Spo0E family protein [Paenibacillus amylolyticus]|uniref:aspartyl-phosphate phosphatase Spo0E family protein n=1 Tax=Paenibacillus amylolyticus TaxID=1451 RepID=UPI0009F9B3AF|nr:aspartyl-phosphate phosphatase Spo0E family protein [Paenibacillus amylolyticus]